jgi:hypothetical protein
MDGNTLEYVKETGFTNAAAATAESAAKPESTLKLDLMSTSAKGHRALLQGFAPGARRRQPAQVDDRPAADVRPRLRRGTELLSGDGTGQHLLGIIPQATAYAAPVPLADLNIIDVIRLAMLQAALAEYPATASSCTRPTGRGSRR